MAASADNILYVLKNVSSPQTHVQSAKDGFLSGACYVYSFLKGSTQYDTVHGDCMINEN